MSTADQANQAKVRREIAEAAAIFAAPENRAAADAALELARREEIAATNSATMEHAKPSPEKESQPATASAPAAEVPPSIAASPSVSTPSAPVAEVQKEKVITGKKIRDTHHRRATSIFGKTIRTVTVSPEIDKARAANAQSKALRQRLQSERTERLKTAAAQRVKQRKNEYEAGRQRGVHGTKGMTKERSEALDKAAAQELAKWESRKVNVSAAQPLPAKPELQKVDELKVSAKNADLQKVDAALTDSRAEASDFARKQAQAKANLASAKSLAAQPKDVGKGKTFEAEI